MNWYLTKIVFRFLCGEGKHTAQFDEQIRLVFAENKIEAFKKAQKLGNYENEVMLNHNQNAVQWKFINVSEIYKLGELMDGAELYSCIKERDDADNYVEMVNRKAAGIIHSDSHEILQLV